MKYKSIKDLMGQRGFTIVELLIVIVVLGVLIGIVIVAYTGVQRNARDTAQAVAVKSWQDILAGYRVSHGGKLPAVTTSAPGLVFVPMEGGNPTRLICLGGDYPADGVFGEGQCVKVGDWTGGVVDKPFMQATADVADISGTNMRKVGAVATYGDGHTETMFTRGIALQFNDPADPDNVVLFYGVEGGCSNNDGGIAGESDEDVTITGNVCIRSLASNK